MVTIKDKQILIDGQPQLIMSGEIHYYRLDPTVWEERILQLKASGCNTVATYVPWLVHEEIEGTIDVTGATSPELNLVHFIDLCHQHGLYFILRPGPFVMAEMKNDGIPYWVHRKYPETVPTTWDGNAITTVTLDYLAPNFLKATKNWYKQLLAVCVPRLKANGGNIIAIQLDNEVGMLSWVSNCPDLTDIVLSDLRQWLQGKYGADLIVRYPFANHDDLAFKRHIQSPEESYTLELMKDLGYYMRYRFAKYIAILRQYCEEFAVIETLYFVNIHGTSAGRGFMFPIGISQLYEAYQQQPDYVSGSDIYLGDLSVATYQDLYIINAYMDAMHNNDQPLTSLEFECGSGDYGETLGLRYDVSASDLKTRMCMAQGFKLINYYLFCGGTNKRLMTTEADGNDRIATTGQRHGFAAPISPEGKPNYTFARMQESIQTMMANGEYLATMTESHDDLVLGFIPDYFMSEYHYPKSDKMRAVLGNITKNRAHGSWEIALKSILMNNYRFGATDLQNQPIPDKKVVLVTSAKYMAANIQQKLVDFCTNGGNIFLYGEFPEFDMEGQPCSILKTALGITKINQHHARQEYFMSVYGVNDALTQPEIRTYFAESYEMNNGIPLLKIYGNDAVCSFEQAIGKGKIIVMTVEYRADKAYFGTLLQNLDVTPKLNHTSEHDGVFMSMSTNGQADYLHILNLDGFDKTFDIQIDGANIFETELEIGSKRGLLLPYNLQISPMVIIKKSTMEICTKTATSVTFRVQGANEYLLVQTQQIIQPADDYTIKKIAADQYKIIPNSGMKNVVLAI